MGKFRSQDDSKDAELKQLLGNSTPEKETATLHGSLPWRRTKKDSTGMSASSNLCLDLQKSPEFRKKK